MHDAPAPQAAAAAERKGDPYTLPTCPVSGKPLGADAFILIMDGSDNPANAGREIRFCCSECADKFKADPAKFIPEIDKQMVGAQLKTYPAGNCAVMTDDELSDPRGPDAMEDKNVILGNRLVRLCCAKCIKKLRAAPEKYLPGVDAAVIAMQKPTYALTTCPISGKALGATAVDIVVANRLVRVCCPGCTAPVLSDPVAAFKKIDAAAATKK